VEHRQVLCVTAGDRVDRAEFTHSVRGAQRRGAAQPRISVRGIAGVELVAASDPVDAGVVDDRVLHRKSEIPRHAEDRINPDVFETAQHVSDHGV
jgi:hypothetical protein